jgi:hypothetical protein
VAVPAANGVGKTYLAADLVASFIADMPAARIILTAPTNRQVSELLWPHVTERLLKLGLANIDWIIPTKPKWSGGDGDKLIGFATNTPMRMQGFHAGNELIIGDEASGMTSAITEALEGIAIAENNYILLIGNPNLAEGAFYTACKQPSYHTEAISSLTHPNILARAEVIPGATTWESLVARVRDWCKEVATATDETFSIEVADSELQSGPSEERRPRNFLPNDAFRIRYLGRFPSSTQWSLIMRNQIDAAMTRDLPGARPKLAALDVARTGGDSTVYGLRIGDTLAREQIVQPSDLMSQAEEIAQILRKDQPEMITIDAAGLGIGLIDRLIEISTTCPIVAFVGSGEPSSPSDRKKYLNRRAACYGRLATAFETERISLPHDTELADELAAVKYRFTGEGQMQMEDKEKIKSVLGRSPDRADMLSLLWETGTDFGFVRYTPPARQEAEKW